MVAHIRFGVVTLLLLAVAMPTAHGESPEQQFQTLLTVGKLAGAEKLVQSQLAADAKDDNARFALGVTQTLQGVEQLMQGLYRYGLDPAWTTSLPFVRLPVPKNPKPEPLTNEAFRKLIADFADDLAAVEATLAKIESDDVSLLLRPGAYRLDFDGDGMAEDDETLWKIFSRVTGQNVDAEAATKFVVMGDKADVHWLRGYCRVLSSMCEMHLAHDTQKLHDHCAQLFFPTAKVLYPPPKVDRDDMWDSILDGIAFIHLLNLPVKEPERMKTAHAHLLAVVEQSRQSWKAILAETDDHREWIPSPQQKDAAMPGAVVNTEMIEGWHAVLDEFEALLAGKKLIPFWRGSDSRGVNLRRVFFEPTTFDLVLWVQGTAAVPYLEKGERTTPEFWNRIQRGFQGQFFWFAIWVN
jgi:hypothetical protein